MKGPVERNGNSRTWARRLSSGTTIATIGVVALMALMPAGQAVSANVHVIPIKVATQSLNLQTQKGGCGTATIVKPMTYAPGTGVLKGSVAATSPACKRGTMNEGISTAEMQIQTKDFHFPASGNLTLTQNWTFTVNETWNMTPYTHCKINYANPSSECMTYVEDTLYVQPEIWDASNRTWGPYGFGLDFAPSIDLYTFSFAYVENLSCAACNYSFGSPGPGAFTGTLNASSVTSLSGLSVVNKSDNFYMDLILEVQSITYALEVDAKTTGTPSASASINMATAGNQARLLGVFVT